VKRSREASLPVPLADSRSDAMDLQQIIQQKVKEKPCSQVRNRVCCSPPNKQRTPRVAIVASCPARFPVTVDSLSNAVGRLSSSGHQLILCRAVALKRQPRWTSLTESLRLIKFKRGGCLCQRVIFFALHSCASPLH
jgi:hypothetical protein